VIVREGQGQQVFGDEEEEREGWRNHWKMKEEEEGFVHSPAHCEGVALNVKI
jgi:hypothetical protein